MQGVLLTAPLDPKLRVADGDEAGRAEAQLCFELLPLLAVAVGTGQLPSVCARARVYARAHACAAESTWRVGAPGGVERVWGLCHTQLSCPSAIPQRLWLETSERHEREETGHGPDFWGRKGRPGSQSELGVRGQPPDPGSLPHELGRHVKGQ